MRYLSGAVYKLLKIVGTSSKHEEILKISSVCTCKEVERGKAVLKVNPLDEQLAKKYFLGAEEQRRTTRGGQILANAALFLTVGGFGWDTASMLDSLVKYGPSATWKKVKRLVDPDKAETKRKMKTFAATSEQVAKRPDLEKLEMKMGSIETQLSEILRVLKKNGKPGADGEKRGGEVSGSGSESD